MGYIENINLFRGNSATGIHLYILSDGQWDMNIVLLEKKKNLIHVIDNYSSISNLEEIENSLPVGVPIILSIEGKGIIHKRVNNTDNTHLVQQVFPNAQPNDFLVQSQEISADLRIISLIRKSAVREIINIFSAKGYHIYTIFLGPFSLNCLWSSFDQQLEKYTVDIYTINREKDRIIQMDIEIEKPALDHYTIAQEVIDSLSLIPYSNAVSFFIHGDLGLSISEDVCLSHKEQFIYKRIFRAAAAGVLVLLFIVLLVNFLVFDNVNKRFFEAQSQFKTDLQLVTRMDSLKAEFQNKEVLIEENGLMTGTRYSFYADRIASLVPEQVALTKLDINPVLSKSGMEKELRFNRNLMLIKGQCKSGFVLDEWMDKLRNESWIKYMEVLQYQQENKRTPGVFILQITY